MTTFEENFFLDSNRLSNVLAVQTENNMRVLSNLLNALAAALDEGRYVHVGSAILWQRHWEHLTKMRRTLALFEYSQVNTKSHTKKRKNILGFL